MCIFNKKRKNNKNNQVLDKDKYIDILQIQERKRSGNRRTVLKVLIAQDKAWPIFKYVATEKVNVVEKRIYTITDYEKICENKFGKEEYIYCPDSLLQEFKNNDECIYVIGVKYKEVPGEHVRCLNNGIVLVCCRKEDFEKINVGDKIQIYLVIFETIDGTGITLYFYNYWSK